MCTKYFCDWKGDRHRLGEKAAIFPVSFHQTVFTCKENDRRFVRRSCKKSGNCVKALPVLRFTAPC